MFIIVEVFGVFEAGCRGNGEYDDYGAPSFKERLGPLLRSQGPYVVVIIAQEVCVIPWSLRSLRVLVTGHLDGDRRRPLELTSPM